MTKKIRLFSGFAASMLGFCVHLPASEGAAALSDGTNTVVYASFESAVENWEEGQTLVLLSDVTTPTVVVSHGGVLDLNGHTLSGDGTGSVLHVLKSLTVRGEGTVSGGNSSYGGGIFVQGGELILEGGSVRGNSAQYGGGICLFAGAVLQMTNGTIEDNSAQYGGGIYVRDSAVSLSCGEITGNRAETDGGGAHIVGENSSAFLEVTGDFRISNNFAINGGGISVWTDGTVLLSGEGRIEENSAQNGGGGVFLHGFSDDRQAVLKTEGGRISSNRSGGQGGGVETAFGGFLEMRGGTVTQNTGEVGGISVYERGRAVFFGEAAVTENLDHSGGKSNLFCWAENVVRFDSSYRGKIGVRMTGEGVLSEKFSSSLDGVFSDLPERELYVENGSLKIRRKPEAVLPVPPPEVQKTELSGGETAVSVMIAFASVTALTVVGIGFFTERKKRGS